MCVCVGKCALVWAKMRVCVCACGQKCVCGCACAHVDKCVCNEKGLAGAYKDKVARAESFKLRWFLHLKKFAAGKDDFFFKKKNFCSAENTKTTSFLKSCNELDVFNEDQTKPSDNFCHLDSSLTCDLLVQAT